MIRNIIVVDRKGRMLLPKHIRNMLGVSFGSLVRFECDGRSLLLEGKA